MRGKRTMSIAGIGLLGPLRVEFSNVEGVLSGAKLRSILAVLALRVDGEVRRDELIEELDLMRTTNDAVNALHAHVARLRRWLQRHGTSADVLETVDSGYRLNLDRDAVDAHRFISLVEHGLSLAPGAPSVVATILKDALSLWRGDALNGAVEGPLMAAAADELRRYRAAAREALVDAWLSLDCHQKVILNASNFIAEDPLNESMRARHIVALQRMGRHAEAVEAYNRAERVLSQELGIRPGAELRAASDPSERFVPRSRDRKREDLMIGASR
jgi:DNA-binding SARP family transcriptional activator